MPAPRQVARPKGRRTNKHPGFPQSSQPPHFKLPRYRPGNSVNSLLSYSAAHNGTLMCLSRATIVQIRPTAVPSPVPCCTRRERRQDTHFRAETNLTRSNPCRRSARAQATMPLTVAHTSSPAAPSLFTLLSDGSHVTGNPCPCWCVGRRSLEL